MQLSMTARCGLVLIAFAYSARTFVGVISVLLARKWVRGSPNRIMNVECSAFLKALTVRDDEGTQNVNNVDQYGPVYLDRVKRWDFQNDGCHCHGYHIGCLKDAYCQWKNHSHDWICKRDCCGLHCVETDRKKR